MKPGRFAYHAPTSVPEVLGLLSEHAGEVKILAGGQSLVPLLSFRMATPEHLIDINRLPGLDTPQRTATGWRIPALARQRTVERSKEIAASVPLLPQALAYVAHPQIRNRGTVCGSVAHADPAAELPAVMTALQARMRLVSQRGERTVAAEDFFLFHLTTAVEEDELLLDVCVDQPPTGTVSAFRELATRHGDFALAAVAGVATLDRDGTATGCRLVAAGVGPTPQRLTGAEQVIVGSRLEPAALAAAESAVRRETHPADDVHACAGYRRDLVGVLTRRVLADISTRGSDDYAA